MGCRAGLAGGLAIAYETVAAMAGCHVEQVELDEQAIIGGTPTEAGEFAATGTLMHGRTFRCTATLIAPDVVITAGHCLDDDGTGFGDFGFSLDSDLTDGTADGVIPALVVHQHPDFQRDGDELSSLAQRNDVGVVILEHPISGVPVEPLDSPEVPADIHTGSELEICGYGRDVWYASDSDGLKRHATMFVDQVSTWEFLTVAGSPQPCIGDSGAPLFAQTSKGRTLVGLVSRGLGESPECDNGGIITRVAPYVDWTATASQDRDTGGCTVGGSEGLWPALLAWLLLALRPKNAAGRTEMIEKNGAGAAGRPRSGGSARRAA